MASPTMQTRIIRERKKASQGKKRKAQNRNQGTTKSKAELFGDKENS